MFKHWVIPILAFCLIGAALAEDSIVLSPSELANSDLMTIVNNYYGCKTWTDGICTECSARYFFNSKGICCEVKPQCQKFNTQVGICEACYQGYSIKDGVCVLSNLVNESDKGCKSWKNGVCEQCSVRWYKGANNVCFPVSDLCRSWNEATGACETCYQGYIPSGGNCVRGPDSTNNDSPTDPLCKVWKNGKCEECAYRAYYSSTGKECRPVLPQCQTWDQFIGSCLSCYSGYVKQNGVCVLATQADNNRLHDNNCKIYDFTQFICLECSERNILSDRRCVPVDDLCKTYNSQGECTSCYKGFALQNKKCVYSEIDRPKDLGCKRWDWDNQICYECSLGWVFKQGSGCVPVDTLCQKWTDMGVCSACYKGYNLKNGVCVISDQTGPSDLGCKRWDWDNQKCLECSARFAFNNGACVAVSDFCSSWNSANGACTDCFKGYNLVNGACVLDKQTGPTDLGCKSWDLIKKVCLECSARFTFKNGICSSVSDFCATWGANGACVSCYKGYNLNNGACILNQQTGPTDLGCKRWDWDKQICLECSARWNFKNGVCVAVNDYCSNVGANNECIACYKGYNLKNGACVLAEQTGPTDLGCKRWDWDNQRCLECSARFTFNFNGLCVAVSDICSSFSANGACTACYKGYYLKNGICVVSEQTGPTDIGCKKWDWDNQKCLECSARFVFKNGVCAPVNDFCSTWNINGLCTACYKGYNLVGGACALAPVTGPTDLGCKRWDSDNQKCLECSARFTFNIKGACVAVSDLCSTFAANGACTTCYKGYYLMNGVCVVSQVSGPTDLGCRKWDWDNQKCLECSARFVFKNSVCAPVDDFCSAWGSNGICATCYKGYNLANGVCTLAPVVGPSDLGCKRWDWDNQKCLECSARFTFNFNGLCVAVSDLCSTFAANGVCTACYKGYNLKNGICVASEQTGPSDLGCKRWDWDNQKCLECSTRWTFKNGVCTPVKDYCSSWGLAGECTACYKGYNLKNGICVVSEQTGPSDLGCKRWDWDNQKCLECSARFTFNINGVCVAVNDLCATFSSNGVCTTCYKGYILVNGVCALAPISGPTDLGCRRWDWDNQRCLECSVRFTFKNGVCVAINDLCATFGADGACVSCYKGYNLVNGACVLAQVSGPSDLGCKKWDWDNQKCLECSARWVFKNGVCAPVNDFCSSWGINGECTACYKGYNLANGACVLDKQTGPSDLGCKKWDWDNQKCLECSNRFTFNIKGVCVAVSDLCSSFAANGACTACYKGYNLKNGICVVSDQTGPTDLGCKRWDWDNQKCLECSARFVFKNGVCTAVNDFCSSWGINGECTACYKGYNLKNGICVASEQTGPTDLGCRRWDWDNQRCLECSVRFTFKNGVCVAINDLCATFGADGACASCYKGYNLVNGACALAPISGPSDLGCKRWDWDNKKCLECSVRFTLKNGVCAPVNDFCSTWDINGLCTACYKGYNLINGACALAPVAGPTDLGCKRWDWDNQKCLECSARFTFNFNGLCVAVSDLCSTFAANGVCTACYKGYNLKNGICVVSEQTGPTDLGCKKWDWDNQKCLECSARFAFNNGVCAPVSNNCATWSNSGQCTSCYTGYALNNGSCQASTLICKTSSVDGSCTTCYNGYVLFRKQCVPISKLASLYQYYAACCPEKLAELQKESRL